MMRSLLLGLLLGLLFIFSTQAEGTKELCPTVADDNKCVLQLFDNNDPNRNFMSYVAPADRRLQFTISNPGEVVYFGFNYELADITVPATLWYRIKDQSGNIVFGPTQVTNTGTGSIGSYAEAVAGPSALVAGGYNAQLFVPAVPGDYYIEFNRNDPNNFINTTVPSTGSRVKTRLRYFDLTVATSVAGSAIPGRLWSKQWDVTTNSVTNPLNTTMYAYTERGFVYSVAFNGVQPFGLVIKCNSTGVTNTGNEVVDRRSVGSNAGLPEYSLFLNLPDALTFPTGTIPTLSDWVTITGCDPNNRCLNVGMNTAGRAKVILDLNGTPGFQLGTSDRVFTVDMLAGGNCVPWDSKDGLGNIVPSGTSISIDVKTLADVIHFPLFDAESNPGGLLVDLVSPTGATVLAFWDDINIPFGTVNLTGCTGTCHTWTGTYGDVRTINTWWEASMANFASVAVVPSSILVDANSLTPGFGAANNVTGCSNTAVPLSATMSGASGVQWTTMGTGTFADATNLTTTYTLSPTDIATGTVELRLASTGNGSCPVAVVDTIKVTVLPGPTINASADVIRCVNNSSATLGATFTIATGMAWSGGAGTFVPNNLTPAATYTPTSTELSAGVVVLLASTTGNGACTAATDPVQITYTPAPIVSTGADLSACANNPAIPLTANFTIASGVNWTGGLGTFTPDAFSSTPVYSPSATELAATTVTLTATTTGNGLCNAVSDQITLTYSAAPTANAGADLTMCADNPSIALTGLASNASAFVWSGGGGTFSSVTSLNTSYTPSAAEIAAVPSLVTLTLQANRVGCNPVSDAMALNITTPPTVSAGANTQICSAQMATLLGSFTAPANAAQWSSAGSGTFTPSANVSNPNYTPSAADISAGSATLSYTTVATVGCLPHAAQMTLTILPSPTVVITATQIDITTVPVPLSASANNHSAVLWTSMGTGSFSSTTNLSTSYDLSAQDSTAASVWIYVSAQSVNCPAVQDSVELRLAAAPTIVFEIPQAFSPNGDGKNDLFIIHGLSIYPKNRLTFYTRDGKVVKEISDYQNDWDGTHSNGNALPNDNYYYVFDGYDSNGKMTRYKGFVEIRRD